MASEKLKALLGALPPRRRRFVEAYLVEPNATQAAITAGLSRKTARSTGQRMLTNADVAAALAEAQNERTARVEVQADEVLRELQTFGHSDPREMFDGRGELLHPKDMPEHVARAIASFEVEKLFAGKGKREQIGTVTKVKFWPKHRGLEMLGRHIRLFGEESPASSITNVFQVTNNQLTVQLDYTRLTVDEHRQLKALLDKATPKEA